MKVEVLEKSNFYLQGVEIEASPPEFPGDSEISRLWEQFNPQIAAIPDRVKQHEAFGVIDHRHDSLTMNTFLYLAGVEVKPDTQPLDGMVVKEVPAGMYAIVYCEGRIDGIAAAFSNFYEEWLPKSGYQSSGVNLEYYGEDFLGNENENSKYQLWCGLK